MSKLINADELEPDTEWSDYYDGFTSYSQWQINGAVEVKAIPLDKIKKVKEEIRKLDDLNPDYPMDRTIHVSRNEVLEILDKLIESEDS